MGHVPLRLILCVIGSTEHSSFDWLSFNHYCPGMMSNAHVYRAVSFDIIDTEEA